MTFNVPPPPPAEPELNEHEHRVAQLSALIRRWRELSAEAAGLQDEMKAIKEQISGLTQPGFKLVVDGVAATHREPNRTFSLALALQHLPVDVKKECVDREPRFDPALIRAKVEELGLLEECMETAEGKPGVVKLA